MKLRSHGGSLGNKLNKTPRFKPTFLAGCIKIPGIGEARIWAFYEVCDDLIHHNSIEDLDDNFLFDEINRKKRRVKKLNISKPIGYMLIAVGVLVGIFGIAITTSSLYDILRIIFGVVPILISFVFLGLGAIAVKK